MWLNNTTMLTTPDISDSLLLALPEATLVLDTATDRILALNAHAADLLKTQQDARFSPLLGPNVPSFIVFAEEVDHRGESWTRDIAIQDAEGDAKACEIRARQLPGQPECLLITLLDLEELERRAQVTETTELQRAGLLEWKRAQGFFAELERQNQLILNAAGEGIYGVNAEGKTTFVNRAAQEMLGWSVEEMLGRDIHNMIHHHHLNGDVYHSHDCPIYRSFRFEQVNRIENEVFWRKDGKPIRVEYVSTPIYDQQVLAGAVVIFRDITERWESEKRLRAALDEVAALRDRLEEENAYLQEAITSERAHHDIIGASPAVQRVLAQIDLVAKTEATVLITGETGTGKALVGSALHKASARSRRPLIHFKCGSVAPEAAEAELFGQVRGAFPGAVRDKPGKLELAHGGTLFLDDVAELPVNIQGRLLHALQTRSVTRLGDTRAKDIDVRVIAATDHTPENAVRSGQLREDLMLFLNVFPITCAPLRDRIDDVPLIAAHLLDIACRRLNRPRPVITEGAMRQLMSYDWPGNVRELHNVIERAAIVSKGKKLIIELGQTETSAAISSMTVKTESEMQKLVRDNIVACLRETQGRVSGANGAAALLGVRPTTFYSRVKTLKIEDFEWS
jgi:PAS domain S-box-containing protein